MEQNNNFEISQKPTVPTNDGKGMSIAALVCGILGVIGLMFGFFVVFAILGLIFGVIGRKKSTIAYGKPSGLATTGFVLGIVGLSIDVLFIIIMVIIAITATMGLL